MSALLVYLSTFVTVFALGLQSLNVNQREFFFAGVTSLAISSGHLWLFRIMPNASWLDTAAYYAGGVTGILASMWVHPYIKTWLARLRARRVDEHADVANCGAHTDTH